MLDVENLSDFEFQQLELRYKELQEERQRLDNDRRRFEVERATQAFQNRLVQNSIDKDNIYAKGDASERRAALKANIQDRVEGASKNVSVDEGISARDIARKLRAQRLAVERKARFGNEDGASNVIESEETKADQQDIDSDSEADDSYSDGSEADYIESDDEEDSHAYYGFGNRNIKSVALWDTRRQFDEKDTDEGKEDTDEEIKDAAGAGAWSHYIETLRRAGSCHAESIFEAANQRRLRDTTIDSKGGSAEEGQKEYEVILREERYRLKKASSFQDPDIEWRLCSTSYIVQDAPEWNKILTFEEGFEVMQRISFDDEASLSSEGSVS
jgi:hypothetical protein